MIVDGSETPALASPVRGRWPAWTRAAALPAAIAVLAASPLLAIWVAGFSFSTRDTVHLFEPLRPLVVSALRAGRLPLWDPYEALGIPLLAQPQHAVLHPVMLLAALVAPGAGLEGVAIVHVALAAVGAFVLARALGASRPGGAIAGLGFGLSGYVLAMTANLPYLAAAASAPWALAAMRAAARPGAVRVPVAAAAVAVLLLAGDPQWALLTICAGTALAFEAEGGRGVARVALAVAIAVALSAVQLAPTWALAQQTSRAGAGLTDAERAQWAFAPWRTLELVVPGFFGGTPGTGVAAVFQALGGTTKYPSPFVWSVHVGAALLLLAVAGARASRASKVIAVAALLCAWLAYGVHLGADPLLRWVPIWGSFRYSEKLIGPFTLCTAVLAGLGADRVTTAMRGRTLRAAIALAIAALVGVLVVGVGGDELLAGWVGEAAAVARSRLLVGLSELLLGAAAFAAVLRWAARSDRPALGGMLLAGIVLLQAALAAPFALHAGQPGVRETDPLRDARARGEVTRIATPARSAANPGPTTLDGLDRNVFQESRMGVAPYAVATGIDHVALYSPLWPARYERVFFAFLRDFGEQRWLAWRRFGLNRVVADTRVTPQAQRAAVAAVEGAVKIVPDTGLGFSVWETPHRPWAAFASAISPATSEDEAYRRLADSISREGSDVVIEDPPPLGTAVGRVLQVERHREWLRIDAEAEGDGVLVVNDAWWPGWTATIDGRPAPILRADVLVRAVAWPAGRHVLEMRYEPLEVRVGALVSLASTIAVLGWVAVALIRRRAHRSGEPRASAG